MQKIDENQKRLSYFDSIYNLVNKMESEISGDKMRKFAAIIYFSVFLALSGTQGFAAGDVAAGEKVFRKCKACHVVNKEQNRQALILSISLAGRPGL